MSQTTLYKQLVTVLETYLGPSAERFVQRHVQSHLDKPLEKRSRSDIPELTTWIKLSLAILSDDKRMVSSCEQELLELSKTSNSLPTSKGHSHSLV